MANPPLNRSAVDAFIGQQPAKSENEAQPTFRERDSTQRMAVNMPKSLYEELRAFMKLTDTPMSDLLVEGARRELARRKQGGI
jgi:hypothetical protein